MRIIVGCEVVAVGDRAGTAGLLAMVGAGMALEVQKGGDAN